MACPISIDQSRLDGRWRWRWRWRDMENRRAGPDAVAAYSFDPDEHTSEYPSLHRPAPLVAVIERFGS